MSQVELGKNPAYRQAFIQELSYYVRVVSLSCCTCSREVGSFSSPALARIGKSDSALDLDWDFS